RGSRQGAKEEQARQGKTGILFSEHFQPWRAFLPLAPWRDCLSLLPLRSPRGPMESIIRLRMSTADGHYAGGLVDGARILQLMSDGVTEALIRNDGNEGLMRAMNAEFLAPVRSGDYLEVKVKLLKVGKSSRHFECT